ncbi:unnamed protein product [Adineta steineri]|uniref:Adenosine deaminase n=1 Tax=Adineta steineri TaxID=433720 RepID=A0A815C621_9BILA|nr:unnamed protein product [Adineta steineri]CAF3596816.1 unnamed protein product [Adineta steineri]
MSLLLILGLLFSILFSNIILLPLPFNQYAYMLAREQIKQHDRAVQGQNNLTSEEKIVNLYFQVLRANDFISTKNYFYPSRPIETELENITNSRFYRFLTLLPKGGNLHLHEFQVLDRKIFLESIKNSPEYDLLYICDQNSCLTKKYYLNYFQNNIPPGWTKVKNSNWTISEIVKKTTLIGMLNNLEKPLYATDTEARWNLASQYGTFSFYADLVKYNETRFNYMKLVLDHALKENVQFLEFRRGFFGNLYYFDKNGLQISINATDELNSLLKFKKKYLSKNPNFIDFIFIIYSIRKSSKDKIKNQINNLINLQKSYPDLIRGYDMVGEEDQGHTLLFHSENLINAFNYSQISNQSFNLLFHAGETNWPEKHIPSNHGDGVSTFENIYDALVLRTHRIGHGLSLAKRPDMYKYISERKIAIEVCPASNQILGYIADLRNHPGIVYHRSGIPIVLAGDDPGSFGYNQLTVDFYLATMAWSLNLADLKQFAWNSIEYSSLPSNRKNQGFQKWRNQWDLFINSSYKLACNQSFSNVIMNISDILPAYGPYDKSINVTLFGSGFEIAICKNITCKFNEKETKGMIVDLNEIICPTPLNNNHLSTVSISLIIDKKIIQSGLKFKFISSLSVIDDGTLNTTTSSKSNKLIVTNNETIIILSILIIIWTF